MGFSIKRNKPDIDKNLLNDLVTRFRNDCNAAARMGIDGWQDMMTATNPKNDDNELSE